MSKDDDDPITPLKWINTSPVTRDVRPEARLTLADRMLAACGKHSTPAQWIEYVVKARKLQKNLFHESTLRPDGRLTIVGGGNNND